MAERGSPEQFFSTPSLDTSSMSARWRHGGWMIYRKRVFEAMERTSQSPNRRRSFGECGSYSWIEKREGQDGGFRVRHNNCHDRLCTPCANARSAKISEALLAAIGSSPVSFITLTLCGRKEPLGELVDRLYKHFRALRLHPLWQDKVRGGAAFLEVKWSDKAQRWHPHLHIIADADFIPQQELSTVWRTISRDSFIVDVRRVKNAEVTGHYVCKYASKPLNSSFSNTPALLDEALLALKGRRLCLCFGTWYGTPLSDAEDATLEDELADGTWKMFSDLESILVRATNGERDAIHILFYAKADAGWRRMLADSS